MIKVPNIICEPVSRLNKIENVAFNQIEDPATTLADILFGYSYCSKCGNMSAVPHGAFAACKARSAMERERGMVVSRLQSSADEKPKHNSTGARELTPVKYNSKLMDSIWGLYNRYSPHNFKTNNASKEVAVIGGAGLQQNFAGTPASMDDVRFMEGLSWC